MKKLLSILGGMIAFVICIVLLVVQVAFLTITTAKSLISYNSISALTNNININEVVSNFQMDLSSELYDVTQSVGINKDDTDKILNSKSFKNFVSLYLTNNIKSIYKDDIKLFEMKDVEKLIYDVEKETGIIVSQKDEIISVIRNNYDKVQASLNISENIKSEIDNETLVQLKEVMSYNILGIFIIVFVIFYLVLCLFRWSLYKPLIWFGITSIISGSLFIVPGLIMNYLISTIGKIPENYSAIISEAIKIVRSKTLLYSLLLIVIGILMIIVYSIIKNKKSDDESNKIENAL